MQDQTNPLKQILELHEKTIQLMHNNAITRSQRAVNQIYRYFLDDSVVRVEILLNLSDSKDNLRD